ncbi:tetratricopeptide repeat protein [Fimbriimonas ginsengisoli]|uniref:Transcriptional activator n=1 Tax=Fimbriimonas ginsengisoli Gsoil 348 TaxID=661478 RepID=A0A068NXH8_FIMGI|nr:tetratricopeptide repeat protein [Fimbriimonas ginsengisoli]AIE87470.1 transcriptional activator [Fimbriimonas ginsengisoli Gsoil 348]
MIELRLFGRYEVTVDGTPLRRLRTHRGHMVLALLGLRLGKPIDRHAIAETVWPYSEPSDALYSLRRTLTDLRQALGTESGAIVSPTPTTLQLDENRVLVDVREYERLIARDATGAIDAADWYRGPLLDGWTEDWVVERRGHYVFGFRDALLRASAMLEAEERFSEATEALRKLLVHEPHDEGLVRRAMHLMERAGNGAGAVALYESFRQRLASELGLSVSDETTRTADEIAGRAKPSKLDNVPVSGSIPVPDGSLVGRSEEIAQLKTRVRTRSLVTLLGLGGIGKTRLGIEVARELEHEFPDGAWFVPLASIREPAEVAMALAAALRPIDPQPNEPAATLATRLSRASFLLLLDNCEHVLDAARDVCASLRTHCPNARIVATSQQTLGLEGEQSFRVPVFDHEDAVRLFCRRAQEASPGLVLSDDGRESVARICRRLEGIPLAIELAAGRARFLTPSRIDELLGERLELLKAPAPGRDPRHCTLDATLGWSLDLLGEADRETLYVASAFAGSWTVDDLLDLTQNTNPVDLVRSLEALVDRSLIVEAETSGRPRFKILDPVRRFAWEMVERGGRANELRDRHLAFVVARCEECQTNMIGVGSAAVHAILTNIQEEISSAFAWAERSGDALSALKIAHLTWSFSWNQGWLELGRTRAERAIAIPGGQRFPREYAHALHTCGAGAWSQADYDVTFTRVSEALVFFKEVDDLDGVARSAFTLGIVMQNQGRSQEALEQLEYSLPLCEKAPGRERYASCLSALALSYFEVLRLDDALEMFDRAIKECQEKDCTNVMVIVQLNLAQTYHALGRTDEAYETFAQARAGALERKIAVMRIMAEHYRAWLDLDMGKPAEAAASFSVGLEEFTKMGERRGVALNVEGMGLAAVAAGDIERGARLLGAASVMREAIPAMRCPAHEARFQRQTATGRQDAGFADAYAAGRELSPGDAVTLAKTVGEEMLSVEPVAYRGN